MEFIFEYVNLSRNNYFEYLIEERLSTIRKKYPFVKRADVFFKVKKNTNNNVNLCEIKLSTTDKQVFASTKERSIEHAINKTTKNLEVQLEKRKEN